MICDKGIRVSCIAFQLSGFDEFLDELAQTWLIEGVQRCQMAFQRRRFFAVCFCEEGEKELERVREDLKDT